MKKAMIVSLACAAAVAVLQAAAPLTPEQTLDRRTIAELEFSPDGSRLVFTVTEPPKGSARSRALWLLDVASGQTRQLTFSGKSDGQPRWSPDGRSIAFVSDRDGVAQLYLLPLGGGEAEKLTDRKEAVGAFRWSPDGRRIALLMNEPKADAQARRERDKDDARVVDKDDRHARIWVVDVDSKAFTQVTTGRWQIRQIEWLPAADGRVRLVATATSKPEVDQWTDRFFTIRMDSGELNEVAAPPGPLGAFAVSPDGTTLAYIGARSDGPDAHDLYLQPIAGGTPPTNLTGTAIDRPVSQPRWIDQQSVAVLIARGFTNALAIVGRDGKAVTLDALDVNPSTFARSASGTFAFAGETATRAPEVWVKPPNAPARAVTKFNEQWASIPLVAPALIKYRSFDDTEIEAAVLRPAMDVARPFQGRDGGPERPALRPALPLVVLVHGGPTGRWTDSFEPWGQLLAARGYAVLYPNVRGSTGYGHTFVAANRANWGGGDFNDVMAGVDALIERGIADPQRLGIGGWSYGGYMAAWAVTQTSRFKAAISGAPMTDLASEFGTEEHSAYDEWFFGTPYENLDSFIKSSPMRWVKYVKTPTLLLQGENDVIDPIGQSQQFYRALKRYGVDSDFVVYPREGHSLREEKHLLDRLNRILAWYDKYLKPNQSSTAQR